MNRLLQCLRTTEPARSSFWSLLLAGMILLGLTGCYTQLAATERVYYEEEAYERQPDRVIVERHEDDSTVIKEYYYYDRSPYYYRRYFSRFYGDPFFYYDCFDPFYYDPFYCFYYGPSFRFRLSFYFGDPFFYWPPAYAGYYWFYGFGYYSPYYWAYYPGYHYHYHYYVPYRGRVVWNYAPRGSSLGRSAWIGSNPRAVGRSGYERDEVRTRSVVRTTRSTAVTPRSSSTGVERHTTQEATRTRARTVTRTRDTQVRDAEQPRTTTGRSAVTREAMRSGERSEDRGAVVRPESQRPTVTRQPSTQGATPRTERAPATRSGDQPSRSTTRTRPRGGNDNRQELQYRPEAGHTYRAPATRTSAPERSPTEILPRRTSPQVHTLAPERSPTVSATPPAPRIWTSPPRSSTPSPRVQSAPAPRPAPAVRSPESRASGSSQAPARSSGGRGSSRSGH